MENWQNTQETQMDDDDEFIPNTFEELPQQQNTQEGIHNFDDDDEDSSDEIDDGLPNNKKRKKKGKETAPCWKKFKRIFIRDENGIKIKHGRCLFCYSVIKADPNKNGTSTLNRHIPICKSNPENMKKQTMLQLNKDGKGEGSVTSWKHDDIRIRKALLNLFIVGELPFKFVENEAFIEYTSALNCKVRLPCRTTISKEVAKYYIDERKKLLTFLSNPLNTVHLTTDTWTSSCQRVNYMVVTAHFIDENWTMHKRIINFRPIDSHRGEDIGREILECIQGWGIKNVMTITVDNATSNDKAMEFLVKVLPTMYAGGKHFHIRCMAHILNLIVKDGLNENEASVKCLQKAVRYIRNSTQRITRFKDCMKELGVQSKKFLCNDCPTRWNSTYELLKIAVDLEDVFLKYRVVDPSFARDIKAPDHEDFVVCKGMVDFLDKFKTKTVLASSTSKPLAHRFFTEICDVDKHIREWSASPQFYLIGTEMQSKFNKYWGKIENLNDYMYFAVLLDPRMKMIFLKNAFERLLEINNRIPNVDIPEFVKKLIEDLEVRFENFFDTYKQKFDIPRCNVSSQNNGSQEVIYDDENGFLGDILVEADNTSSTMQTELKSYLDEPTTRYTKDFDILLWWKQNASRYPIVSRMAKDLLAIQISTVASESAFSTSGRILDPYRSNLATPIVEALVCTQDWVRKSRKPIVDNIEDILQDDDVAKELEEVLRKEKRI